MTATPTHSVPAQPRRRRGLLPRPILPGSMLLAATLVGGAFIFNTETVSGQTGNQDWCSESRDRNEDRHCEVRELTLDTQDGRLSVDVGANGGIRVEGWAGSDVRVSARVQTRARNEAAARELAQEVEVLARPGSLTAEGPRSRGRESWSVSVRVQVPTGTELELRTTNGGITVADTDAGVSAHTTNGGVRLTGVSGPIEARTTNGGIRAELSRQTPLQDDIQLRTINGGIELALPEGLSARIDASTTNGGINTDFPITVQGRIGRRLTGVLGEGGPEIRATTTNGGIRLVRN